MFTKFGEPEIRASQHKKCFYCGNDLPAKNKEHIFNSSWGGSHKTGELICNECNSAFSQEEVDSAFLVYTTSVMNAWAFKGERHKEVPKIIPNDDYILDARGQLKLNSPKVEEEFQPDGSYKIGFSFNSKGEARRWFLDGNGVEAYLGRSLTEDEKQYFRQLIAQTDFHIEDAKPQAVSVGIDLRKQYRSAAHTILKCLGLYTPDSVRSDLMHEVRSFARYDQGSWLNFAVEAHPYFSLVDQATNVFRVRYNTVEIYWSSLLKKIIGVITLLDRVKRAVVIAEDYTGPDAILSVVEDTYSTKKTPKAVFVELDSNLPPLPLINIKKFSHSIETFNFFYYELSSLLSIYYPIDSLSSRLISGIEKIGEKVPKLNEQSLEECINLFVDFAVNLGKLVGTSLDSQEARSKVLNYGFSILAQKHMEKSWKDTEVSSIMEATLKMLVTDFQ